MEKIPLRELELVVFDKSNPMHITFLKNLANDKSILKWFQGLAVGLLHNYGHEFFDRAFFVSKEGNLIGYVHIGAFNEQEKSVYLKAATSAEERGKGYGKLLLAEITEYIFNHHLEVESIRLKINKENTASLNTASACNYKWLIDDFYISYNPNLEIKSDVIQK